MTDDDLPDIFQPPPRKPMAPLGCFVLSCVVAAVVILALYSFVGVF
jgi:hypothetical protein